jgi:diguanylate cyclase (GGDEF)-like protein
MTALSGLSVHFERKYAGLYLEQTIDPILRPDGGDLVGAISYVRDVSHREKNRLAAVDLAIKDPLTGLYNARHFERRLEQIKPVASVLYLDVDGLKAINDTGGHKAGDVALVAVAAAIAANTREKKDVAARLHGDEYAILLASTGRVAASLVAARIRAALVTSGGPTVSIGIATCPDDTCDPRALGELADARLYADKRARRR